MLERRRVLYFTFWSKLMGPAMWGTNHDPIAWLKVAQESTAHAGGRSR